MEIKKNIINNLIDLRGEKILPLSKKTGINRGNLSLWLKDAKGGYLSEEKVHTLSQALGYDEKEGKLLSGIHRFFLDSQNLDDFFFSLEFMFPSGGEFRNLLISLFQRKSSPLSKEIGEEEKKGEKIHIYRSYLIVFPRESGARIICSVSYEDSIWRNFFSWLEVKSEWAFDNLTGREGRLIINSLSLNSKIEDENLTVFDLDGIFGFDAGKFRLSWDMLLEKMKTSGKTPEELARKLGLDDTKESKNNPTQ